jgi:ABC-type branched-subunit amino acid transport system ATPase component/ABC-type branched-subunit amino acid transport system permease subunit
MTFLAPARTNLAALGIVIAAATAGVFLLHDSYHLLVLALVAVWALLGLAWNILGGYGGLISFGHAAFFGSGAYTVAILFHDHGVSPWLGLVAGGIMGSLVGVVIGFATFRLKGHYFSLAMLAYPLALMPIFSWAGWNEVSLPLERANPAAYMQFSDPRIMPLIALALLGAGAWICLHIERTRLGLVLYAIRQNELAAQAAGIATLRWKVLAIAISGALAGLAGSLYAVLLLIVTPASAFGMLVSAQALIVSMFGGLGSAWGPLIGAAVLVPLAEALNATIGSRLPGIEGVVFGIAIMAIILWRPQGIFWALRDRFAGRALPPLRPHLATPDLRPPVTRAPVPAGQTALVVRAITVRFGGLQALCEVSLEVCAGEILGIIGPNGAGKTTLFNVLDGITRPAAGSARFAGRELIGLPPQQVCALGIGRTFQTVRAFPRLTLIENVVVGAFGVARSNAAALEIARAAVARVGLADHELVPASRLTNRELRLMELARALAGQPSLILMDESFAGLSGEDIEAMIGLIRQLRADGLTIAIIEHTMDAMVRLADRFVVLDHGSVIATGHPQAVIRDRQVVSAYLGKRWVEHAGG